MILYWSRYLFRASIVCIWRSVQRMFQRLPFCIHIQCLECSFWGSTNWDTQWTVVLYVSWLISVLLYFIFLIQLCFSICDVSVIINNMFIGQLYRIREVYCNHSYWPSTSKLSSLKLVNISADDPFSIHYPLKLPAEPSGSLPEYHKFIHFF